MRSHVDFQLQQLRPLLGPTVTALARTAPGDDVCEPEYSGSC